MIQKTAWDSMRRATRRGPQTAAPIAGPKMPGINEDYSTVSTTTSHKAQSGAGKPTQFEQVVLLLQGGGALGSYQTGVYQALAEAQLHPDWVAGISIGAINSALIAGNSPRQAR
jgi:predicted acylesterase/phospholipase RssA